MNVRINVQFNFNDFLVIQSLFDKFIRNMEIFKKANHDKKK